MSLTCGLITAETTSGKEPGKEPDTDSLHSTVRTIEMKPKQYSFVPGFIQLVLSAANTYTRKDLLSDAELQQQSQWCNLGTAYYWRCEHMTFKRLLK